jgi:hypothetical protein
MQLVSTSPDLFDELFANPSPTPAPMIEAAPSVPRAETHMPPIVATSVSSMAPVAAKLRKSITPHLDVVEDMTPLEDACFAAHNAMHLGTQVEYVNCIKQYLSENPVIRIGGAFAGCDIFTQSLRAVRRFWSTTYGIDCTIKLEWLA